MMMIDNDDAHPKAEGEINIHETVRDQGFEEEEEEVW